MTNYLSTHQLQDLFSFPFRDPQWKRKFIIGALLTLSVYTIVLAPIQILVMGYYFRIMKRIIVEGGEPHLPDWEDWGQLFIDGLKMAIPGLIFSLPGLLLLFLSFGGSFLSMFSIGISDVNNQFLQPLEPVLPLFPVIGMLFFVVFFGSGILVSIALGFLRAPAICHVVATDRISGALRIKEWGKIFKANFMGFLMANIILYCISMGLSMISQILSMTFVLIILLPVIGSVVGLFAACIYYVLIAQAYVSGRRTVVPID